MRTWEWLPEIRGGFDYDQLPTNPVDKSVDELLLTAASARSRLRFSKWLQSSRLRHKIGQDGQRDERSDVIQAKDIACERGPRWLWTLNLSFLGKAFGGNHATLCYARAPTGPRIVRR